MSYKKLNYDTPKGISKARQTQIITEVLNIINRYEPIGGYSSPVPAREDKLVLKVVADYLNTIREIRVPPGAKPWSANWNTKAPVNRSRLHRPLAKRLGRKKR